MRLVQLLLFTALLALAGCANVGKPTLDVTPTSAPYRLDTGDVIRVSVYNDQQLTNTYGIDDSGHTAMPLVGRIYLRGKTTSEASALITARLAGSYLRDPNVAVEVATYRPFFIEGEVTNSGQFAYVYGMTVRDAIAVAGGFTDVAQRNSVTLYRKQNGRVWEHKVPLDFVIKPSDTIVVHERWI
ncbi:polysaccharide biosynthesis/export family protein [Maritalea mediterranea]|uniref:Polysaccharide export protein n=1 Tax=Maritalea mediterranea TaxID=2909667 RepID=A0ABS9E5T3_9HYPH|nr:polysaccharide biosynthesis/export family protein [Maritalea mediterranea]MCF4098211.1 polysaccharide export protein [Maritalea mediterranea]